VIAASGSQKASTTEAIAKPGSEASGPASTLDLGVAWLKSSGCFLEPARLKRPAPPATMLDPENFETPTFVPAPELETWLRTTFINVGAQLQNEGHFHLRFAQMGVLWTSIENSRHGRRVVGQAERGDPAGIGK
jgi:hypothetical protein